ncbi:hypothetical protein LSAT2_008044, partial [Lamellibrachia satsuma]
RQPPGKRCSISVRPRAYRPPRVRRQAAFETTEPASHKPKTARTMTADEGAYQNS